MGKKKAIVYECWDSGDGDDDTCAIDIEGVSSAEDAAECYAEQVRGGADYVRVTVRSPDKTVDRFRIDFESVVTSRRMR